MRHVIVATGKEKGNAMAEQNRWVEAKAESKKGVHIFRRLSEIGRKKGWNGYEVRQPRRSGQSVMVGICNTVYRLGEALLTVAISSDMLNINMAEQAPGRCSK